jgi:hypothetical protein
MLIGDFVLVRYFLHSAKLLRTMMLKSLLGIQVLGCIWTPMAGHLPVHSSLCWNHCFDRENTSNRGGPEHSEDGDFELRRI